MKVFYGLLILVPIAVVLKLLGMAPTWVFLASAAAMIPVSAVLGKATEELTVHTGPRVGGLLNVTLGNAAELILTLTAIRANLYDLVRASIAGSILGNVLLVLGASLLFGGLRHGVQRFDSRLVGMSSTMMALAVVALVLPGVFTRGNHSVPESRFEQLSLVVAGVLIVLYLLYIVWTIILPGRAAPGGSGGLLATLAEGTPGKHERDAEDGASAWRLPVALGVLAGVTVGAVVASDLLIGAIEPVVEQWGLTQLFLGVILVPIIGNAAEHVAAVQAALRDDMDLAISIGLGSSLQIALFVAPVLVFASLAIGHPLYLVFNFYELTALGGAVVIATLIAVDGESNWVEGVQLVALYAIVGVAFLLLR